MQRIVIVLFVVCTTTALAGAESDTWDFSQPVDWTAIGPIASADVEREPGTDEESATSKFSRDLAPEAGAEGGESAAGQTGNDPRNFRSKFTPYFRYGRLRNDLESYDFTLSGLYAITPRFAMAYELPLAKGVNYNSSTGPGIDNQWGMGDLILRFLYQPRVEGITDFTWDNWGPGPRKKHNLSLIPLLEMTLPTHTHDALGQDSVTLSPGFAVAMDMPMMGFIAMMNFLDISAGHWDGTPYTLRYRARIFYQQPLTKPGPGLLDGLYIMPEIQPAYDFNSNHFSLWIAPEFGKIVREGFIVYAKPGWGWKTGTHESTDRDFTFEFGVRIFF